MPGRLQGRKVVVLLDEGFEDLEFWVTVMRLREEGAARHDRRPAGRASTVRGKHGLEATADVAVGAVRAGDVRRVVVPGGWAPDKLRRLRERDAPRPRDARRGQDRRPDLPRRASWGSRPASWPVGRATGSLGIKDDLVNAGATWVDEPAFRDGNARVGPGGGGHPRLLPRARGRRSRSREPSSTRAAPAERRARGDRRRRGRRRHRVPRRAGRTAAAHRGGSPAALHAHDAGRGGRVPAAVRRARGARARARVGRAVPQLRRRHRAADVRPRRARARLPVARDIGADRGAAT